MSSTFSIVRPEQVAIGRPCRRDAEAAVARDHCRHAVIAGRRERGIPEHLRVVMRVDVDEAGGDDAAISIEPAISAQPSADLDDAVTLDGDIGRDGGCARPVDDLASCNHDTVHEGSSRHGPASHPVSAPNVSTSRAS